jgi:hypothetical protein
MLALSVLSDINEVVRKGLGSAFSRFTRGDLVFIFRLLEMGGRHASRIRQA